MNSAGLYIQLFSIHGLIRGEAPELGRDADTGGQVKYVLELARDLGKHPEVDQVDLVTRLIDDKTVSSMYAKPVEQLADNVRIIRIQCGGRKYIRKELLWPHLEEFIDKTIKLLKSQKRVPDVFTATMPMLDMLPWSWPQPLMPLLFLPAIPWDVTKKQSWKPAASTPMKSTDNIK